MTYSIETDLIAGLPAGWGHRRLKQVAEVVPSNVDKHSVEGQTAVRLCNYVDTYKNERITSSIEFMPATATAGQIERLSLKKGDMTITKDSESPWDIAVPAYVAEDIEGLVCGYHLSKISPAAGVMDGGYLSWALRSHPVNVQFALSAQGITRYGLSSSGLADGVVPMPPLREQIAIASYLDAETARIDGLIAEKQQLASLLSELRASIMGDAVQQGLRPDAEVDQTGVPWLGSVPVHWRVVRLKHLLDTIEQGWSPQCDGRQAEEHEWGVLKAGACNGGVFRPEEHKALQSGMVGDASIEVRPGDVLMSRASGSLDLVGSVAYVRNVRPGLMLSDKIFRLRLDQAQETSPEWLAMVFNTPTQRRQIASCVGGAEGLARNITSAAIRELWLAVPPPDEQQAIVEHVSVRLERVEALSEAVTREIVLLQELRSATITDAVLRRIDVRAHMKTDRAREAAA